MRGLIVALVVAVMLVLAGASLVGIYFSYANWGIAQEERVKKMWEDNRQIHANYTLRVQEMAQIPEMYRDDLLKVVTETFEGRYGNDGSRGVMQWIQEQNLPLDPSMYTKIQTTIESGRLEFANKQTALLDVKRGYETALRQPWSGFWLRLYGLPGVDLDKYDVVLAGNTERIFDSKVDPGIQLRAKPGVE